MFPYVKKREPKKPPNQKSSMDFTIGIKCGNESRMLLCELKLNVNNLKNLNKGDLKAKLMVPEFC